jgi:hypothetical protein
LKQTISSKFLNPEFLYPGLNDQWRSVLDRRAVNDFFIQHHSMARLYLYIGIVFCSGLSRSFAQTTLNDSSFYQNAINNIIHLYTDSVKESLHLYSGTEFTGGYRSSAGHPFFENAEPQQGAIFYNGVRYPDVLLKYDLTKDEVIFINPNNNLSIKLITQKIAGFSIKGRLFIQIPEAKGMANFPGAGFYEILYDGTVQVLAKRTKRLRQAAKAEDLAKFKQTNTYYVRKDSAWYEIDNKKSLLAVCRDYKTEVIKFMQQENLNFKSDPEPTLVKVIDYYIQLKK